jgi:hypothetical protein
MKLVSDVSLFLSVKGAGKLLSVILLYGMGTGILAPMNAIYLHDHIGLSKGEVAARYETTARSNKYPSTIALARFGK